MLHAPGKRQKESPVWGLEENDISLTGLKEQKKSLQLRPARPHPKQVLPPFTGKISLLPKVTEPLLEIFIHAKQLQEH